MTERGVSVVMATWNGAAFVEEQLRSILAQEPPPGEIIIADDCSSDDTVERVERMLNSSTVPHLVTRNPERLGVVVNYEQALRSASGQVIVLSDQDDVWRPGKLAAISSVLVGSSTGPTALFSNADLCDANGHVIAAALWGRVGFDARSRRLWAEGQELRVLLRHNVVTGATLAFEAACLDLVLPFSRHGLHDAWIALLIAATGSLCLLDQRLILYRLHGSNVAGLAARGPRGRLRQRRRQRQLRGEEVAFYRDLAARLTGRASPTVLKMVTEKIELTEFRADLPSRFAARASRVVQRTRQGAYARYAENGVLSALSDVAFG